MRSLALSAFVVLVLASADAGAQVAGPPAPGPAPWAPPYPWTPPYPPGQAPTASAPPWAPRGAPAVAPTPPPPRQTSSSRVLGLEIVDADGDTDVAVGRARINAADPRVRDVAESEPEERREAEGRRVTLFPEIGLATNDLNVGVGVHAGVTLATPVYIGGAVTYYFGETAQVPGAPGLDKGYVTPAAEVGYDFGIGPILARPYVGAGLFVRHTSSRALDASGTDASLLLYPGLAVRYVVPRTLIYVGGDARVLVPTALESPALGVFASAGTAL